jgi:Tryptophan-associated transmembrane protein (Trp_oprn_chp)
VAKTIPLRSGRLGWGLLPTVVAALAMGSLVAFATTQNWLSIDAGDGIVSTAGVAELADGSTVASSLNWVVLASWGAVLVTRGGVRRACAAIGALASAGVMGAIIQWMLVSPQAAGRVLTEAGAAGVEVGLRGWCWLALLGSLATFGLAIQATRSMAGWPEMGQRYDAPSRPPTSPGETDLNSSPDVWKAIDEGRDPTTLPDA